MAYRESAERPPVRVIPCLDVADGRVVKGTRFGDLRDIGDPVELAADYERQGADEIVFLDITASHEGRATVVELADRAGEALTIPYTVGGGVGSTAEAEAVLRAGADKVTVNSAALERPELIGALSARFGAQCVVVAIDAARAADGWYEAYRHGGREATGRDAVAWAAEAADRGAGEILLTSMDQDGVTAGYDRELLQRVTGTVTRPVIASGGAGHPDHLADAVRDGADAVLCASILHDGTFSLAEVKERLAGQGVPVRPLEQDPFPEPVTGEPRIAVVEYGMGNRRSVQRALERAGADTVVTADPVEIAYADGLVLPGVGAFPAAMDRLREDGLVDVLDRFRIGGRPVLGICLGEQLFFQVSHEHGQTPGLQWLEGEVTDLSLPILPNMGWREVDLVRPGGLGSDVASGEMFYHAHSYAAEPRDPGEVVAVTRLAQPGGQADAVSAVRRGNLTGVQFHPEKSGAAGVRALKGFVASCRPQA